MNTVSNPYLLGSHAPVCGPLRLHSLSPCRMAKTRCSELPMSLKIQGSVFPA